MRALLAAGPPGVAVIAASPRSSLTEKERAASPCSTSLSCSRVLKSSVSLKRSWRCWLALTYNCLRENEVVAQMIPNSPSTMNGAPCSSAEVSVDPDSCPFTIAPSLVVFSGGTAFNGVVEELKKFTTRVAHVLPVSDDGGSTSEIVRVLGGPAVGDIRSRCLRLSDETTAEALAVKSLLGHRLSLNESEAKAEWYEIVEGEHGLWRGVSGPYRETIRAFLVHFQTQILRHSNARFKFRNGSIGNFFFAGARIFLQSLEAAIFLYSRVCQCPTDSLVLAAICTNDRLTIGAELQDRTIIRGQNEISHPSVTKNDQGVNKTGPSSVALPSPIKRIFYMSNENEELLHELYPKVNSAVVEQLNQVDAIVYGMGSLYTSICPTLVLRGVAESVVRRDCPKILIINGSHDRETSGMSVSDIVIAICDTLNRKFCQESKYVLAHLPWHYVNVVLVPKGGEINVDREKLDALHIRTVIEVDSIVDPDVGLIYNPKSLIRALHDVLQAATSWII